MKWSTATLIALMVLVVFGLLVSNIAIKREYEKVDKTDLYWTYGKVLEQPFRYLNLEGGNVTRIAYEQSPNCSVRVLHDWQRNQEDPMKTWVSHDTLYVRFTFIPEDGGEKYWMQRATLIRIFSPELFCVTGHNTNLGMFKLRQQNLQVSMSGKSKFEVESFVPDLDSVIVSLKDSSEVVFEMSPDYLPENKKRTASSPGDTSPIKSNEAMRIGNLQANVEGYSLLDVGHAQIGSLGLVVADSSAIILSGGALGRYCKIIR